LLNTVAQAMRRRRLESGSLDLGEVPSLRITVERDTVKVSDYDALGEQSRQLVLTLAMPDVAVVAGVGAWNVVLGVDVFCRRWSTRFWCLVAF
jgi:hypothetical protein